MVQRSDNPLVAYPAVADPATIAAVAGDRSEQAYVKLVTLIERRLVTDQDMLSHRRLAERLDMSTQPVRLALRRLEQEGVVETLPRVGTRLRRIDAHDFWGQLQWRIALETQVARLASTWLDAHHHPALIERARRVDRGAARREPDSAKADAQFHLGLAESCGASRLRVEMERLNIYHMKLAICEVVEAARGTAAPPAPPPDHEAVVDAIFTGDPDRAADAIRRHIEHSDIVYGFADWYRRKFRERR